MISVIIHFSLRDRGCDFAPEKIPEEGAEFPWPRTLNAPRGVLSRGRCSEKSGPRKKM